ncbi:MAG: DUF3883 domain-containing protein [Candidatus Zapsychrus exili]|nr:DUF3883 domain-containing protein [Candidatus Zapsychrus exili]
MLVDLSKYDNLGSPNIFFALLSQINNSDSTWTFDDASAFFYNKMIDGRLVFDGCINFALSIDMLVLEDNNIKIEEEFRQNLKSKEELTDKIIQRLFQVLKQDDLFYHIFSSKNLSYDAVYKTIKLGNLAFGSKFAGFKQLLLAFEVIKNHPIVEFDSFIVNPSYKGLLDRDILPQVRKMKLSVEDFDFLMEKKRLYGEEAERFVLEFEKKRLNNEKEVEWVAMYTVNEGYDIASYDCLSDDHINRFIEVKSYEGDEPYFFWTRNEALIAKQKKSHYWLYLINRKKVNGKNYQPEMYQNPIESIMGNNLWHKEPETWRISIKKAEEPDRDKKLGVI